LKGISVDEKAAKKNAKKSTTLLTNIKEEHTPSGTVDVPRNLSYGFLKDFIGGEDQKEEKKKR